jgi:hypothetical protein
MLFSELKSDCPHRRDWTNAGGGTCSDCTLHDSGNKPECCATICPLFESDDETGDYEYMRGDHEIEGTPCVVKAK